MKTDSDNKQPLRLPKNLYKFFWDYPPGKLSWEADQDLIIRRILTTGSWKAIVWLRKQMGDDALKQRLLSYRGKGLSPRQIRFWELLLDLPKHKTNEWVRDAQSMPWTQR